jgi:hypothetical protein
MQFLQSRQLRLSIGPRITDKLVFLIKFATLAVCLFVAFSGHYPPLAAQILPPPVLTYEDAIQDHDIAQVNKHIEATDARVQKQGESLNILANEMAGLQGEERIIGAVLSLLSGGGIILQLRKKSA